MIDILQSILFIFLAIGGTAVVFTRNPVNQAIGLAFYGVLLSLMFFLLRAPDVALSQIVIGAFAVPLMVLVTLARMRREDLQDEEHKR